MSNLPKFNNLALLRCALTHSSYRHENSEIKEDNERLEFLGDALLGFLVGALLYERYPQMDEGELTKLRSALVDEQHLAKLAKNLNIGSKMLLGNGEKLNGGFNKPKLLSSTFEAIIGAYYLDAGIIATRDFIEPIFVEIANKIIELQSNKNYKSLLQKYSLEKFVELPKYEIAEESGADHNKEFTAKVWVNGKLHGTGKGRSKKDAEKSAAENALKKLELI
jgi:ribonuclease III